MVPIEGFWLSYFFVYTNFAFGSVHIQAKVKHNSNIQSKKMKTRQPLNANHSATQDKNEERKHNEDR